MSSALHLGNSDCGDRSVDHVVAQFEAEFNRFSQADAIQHLIIRRRLNDAIDDAQDVGERSFSDRADRAMG